MEKLLEIRNLDININNTKIVKNLFLSISKAKTVALVGESGSGKSLTAHAILKLLPKEVSFNKQAQILFEDKDIFNFSKNDILALRGNKISMIFQEPMSALNPLHKVKKQIAEIVEIHQLLSKKQTELKVLELLEKVELHKYGNLEKIANAYPHELSGGQRQRVMIAMAIANNPKLLIADEPTTALDLTTQYQILNLLEKLKKEYQMSILLITHDLTIVKRYSQYIYVINKGEIIESNYTEELFNNPQKEYTKELLFCNNQIESYVHNNKNKLLKIENLNVEFSIKKSLFKRFEKTFMAVNNVSFDIYERDSFGIIGESGSGKSSLAQAILKLINSSGKIEIMNEDINLLSKNKLREFRKNMQIVFQDPFNSLNPRMSIFSIISEGLDIHTKLTKVEKEKAVLDILKEVEMPEDCIYRFPHEFSGGQRQRIAVARALILRPKILILDEPTSALDRQVQFALLNLLKRLQEKYNLTYLFISHDLNLIQAICNNVAVMKEGKIVELNTTKELFSKPVNEYTKLLIEASK